MKEDANQREMNLTSELESKNECIGALKDEKMKETLTEGIKTKLHMERFLPTIIEDSNNNIKKRKIHDSQALLIQNGNSSTTPLLLAPELPQNEITDPRTWLGFDPLRRSSMQPLMLAQQLSSTASTPLFDDNNEMDKVEEIEGEEWWEEIEEGEDDNNEEWLEEIVEEEENINTENDNDENTLMPVSNEEEEEEEWEEEENINTGNDNKNTLLSVSLLPYNENNTNKKTGNDGVIDLTANVKFALKQQVPGEEATRENRLEQLSDINPFLLLQIDHKATRSEKKAAHDKLLLVHHPDKNSHPDDKETANENSRIIFEACKKLLAPKHIKRKIHKKSAVNPKWNFTAAKRKKEKKRSSTNKRKEDSRRPRRNTRSHSTLPNGKLNDKHICNNLQFCAYRR